MNVYISQESLSNSIQYFTDLNVSSPEQLGLFFFFKSLGTNTQEFISFVKKGQMSQEEKDYYNNQLHHLGGIFSSIDEEGGKRTCLFPFSIEHDIKQKQFYNGGSTFQQLLSRISDTIDNTLVDKFLDKDSEENIKFKRKYIELIDEEYLKGNKISIVNLSVWLCRFINFEIGKDILDNEFTRIIIKYTKEYFHISEKEFAELFYDDSLNKEIKYSYNPISGEELRDLLNFSNSPEIVPATDSSLNIEPLIISTEDTRRLIELSGLNPSSQEIKEVLELNKQVVLYGIPGVGKSMFISDIEKDYDDVTKIQFHPSTSYEHFIGGTTLHEGTIITQAGKFLEICVEASKSENSKKKFLFVIDEINRGNISNIFGEAILALDREYEVDLIKPIELNGELIHSFKIPENLYLIATMNSSDRSIAVLDYAFRRRFAFVKLFPNYEVVKDMSILHSIGINIEQLYKSLNNKINEVLSDEDLLLGQSYFLPSFIEKENGRLLWTIKDLRFVFNYTILPILEEYTYGDKNDLISIIGEPISSRIYEDAEFIQEIKNKFPEVEI